MIHFSVHERYKEIRKLGHMLKLPDKSTPPTPQDGEIPVKSARILPAVSGTAETRNTVKTRERTKVYTTKRPSCLTQYTCDTQALMVIQHVPNVSESFDWCIFDFYSDQSDLTVAKFPHCIRNMHWGFIGRWWRIAV